MGLSEGTLSAEDTWIEEIALPAGNFTLSISGTFEAVVTVQRSYDDGVTWGNCGDFSVPSELNGKEGLGALYRAGIKTGNYASGDVGCH